MTIHIKLKGGPGSGWHAPPRGTHSGDKHRAVGSGKASPPTAPAGRVASSDGLASILNAKLRKSKTGEPWEKASHAKQKKAKQDAAFAVASRGGDYDVTVEAMRDWAAGGTGESPLQQAASETFKIPMSEYTAAKILDVYGPNATEVMEEIMPLADGKRALGGMYIATQSALLDAGYTKTDKITLYRGIQYAPSDLTSGQMASVRSHGSIVASGNPLESWSISPKIAKEFAVGAHSGNIGVVLRMDVPVKNIVSTARTGIGCLIEGEVVTMGSIPTPASVDWHTGDAE